MKTEQVVTRVFGLLCVACAIMLAINLGVNLYKAASSIDSIESFEIQKGENSLTCVTAWIGVQAQMSCLPTQWMEAEVVYDQADFEAPAP